MKKTIALILSVLLTLSLFAFAGCGDDAAEDPTQSAEATTTMFVKVDYSAFVNYADAVANLNAKTALNNYSSASGYLDKLLAEGNAMKQKIKDEKIKDAEGLEAFEAAFKTVEGLWDTAEEAAGKYVKGFYKVNGKKDVTAVYCYMNANPGGEKGSSYIFALTYLEGETPVTVYMNNTATSDIVEVSVYEETPEKFYSTECENSMTNTPVYNNITLDLDKVLSKAK